MILINIISNENLNRFSSLTNVKVSGLTICLETVKLIEYGIKEIDRELLKSKQSTSKVQFYLKLWCSEQISSNIIVKSCDIQAEHPWTFNFFIIEAIIWLIFLGTDLKIV